MLRYMVKNTYKYKIAILNDNMILTQVDKKKFQLHGIVLVNFMFFTVRNAKMISISLHRVQLFAKYVEFKF